MFIDNAVDALVFFVLTHIIFHDYFSTSGSQYTASKYYKTFFQDYRRRMWLPPRWVFPIVWTILFILIEASMFIFHKEVIHGDYVATTIFVLFLINIIANKQWSPVFIRTRQFGWALFLVLLILVTGITMLIIFALNNLWISFGTFLPYILWSLFALYLNGMVMWVGPESKSSSSC